MISRLADRYRLGHPDIDRQHRRIFEIAASADDGAAPKSLLDDLLGYTEYHFGSEEYIAEDAGVVVGEHAEAHARLLERIRVMLLQPDQHVLRSRDLISHWITTHIDHQDRLLVRHIMTARTLFRVRDDADDDLVE